MEQIYNNWDRDVNPPIWSFVRNTLKDCFEKKVEVVEHFNGMSEDDKGRFLNGCVNLFGKYGRVRRKNERLRENIKEMEQFIPDDNSFESMWKYHSYHQNKLKELENKLREMKQKIITLKKVNVDSKIKEKNQIIDNQKKGYDGLIKRNLELQNRIFYEEKVNRLLKERIKNFEELCSGGDVLENIL